MKKIKKITTIIFLALVIILGKYNSVEAAIRENTKEKYPESFKTISSALNNYRDMAKFELKEMSRDDVSPLIQEIMNNNINGYHIESWIVWENGNIEFNYNLKKEERIKIDRETDVAAENILHEIIKEDFTNKDKVKAIHDYITETTNYSDEESSGELRRTAYGAIIKKEANCDGFTRAASILLDKLEIENYYIIGWVDKNLHAWNLVEIDGKYYHMDLSSERLQYVSEKDMTYYFFLNGNKQISDYGQVWNSKNYNINISD